MTTLTSKGQVTIPKRVRDHLRLEPGSQVVFDLAPDGHVVISRADAPPAKGNRFQRFRGVAGPGLSTDEIMALMRGEED